MTATIDRTFPWSDGRRAANGSSVAENFAAWIGNSQVLDASGVPLVAYPGAFDVSGFDEHGAFSYDAKGVNDYGDVEIGFFFAGPSIASSFAGDNSGAAIIPVYLRIEKPAEFDAFQWCQMLQDFRSEDWARFKDGLLLQGHDGIRISALPEGIHLDADDVHDPVNYFGSQFLETNWVAFHPNQIKSALGNCGLYAKSSAELTDHGVQEALLRAQRVRALLDERLLSRHERGLAPF